MYMAENFDLYLSSRLLDVALGRRRAREEVVKNRGTLSSDSVVASDGSIFSVKSASIPNKM